MSASDGGAIRYVVIQRRATGWPDRLEHLADPPERLWLAGPARVARPAVAVVGCRSPSLAGLDVARALGRDLALAGVPVISGMARGIDAAAHLGALDAGGSSVAVLGNGVDVCYPAENRRLRDRLLQTGLLVSEDPPGTEPARWRFPRRNRIIAALACAVVVVEAGESSGALSTARHAADLGREILAVPGSILSDRSVGSNRLIRDGATPLLEIGDVFTAVAELGPLIPPLEPAEAPDVGGVRSRSGLGRRLLGLLSGGPAHPDALAAAAGVDAAALSVELTRLEIDGLVRSTSGGLVERRPPRR